MFEVIDYPSAKDSVIVEIVVFPQLAESLNAYRIFDGMLHILAAISIVY